MFGSLSTIDSRSLNILGVASWSLPDEDLDLLVKLEVSDDVDFPNNT